MGNPKFIIKISRKNVLHTRVTVNNHSSSTVAFSHNDGFAPRTTLWFEGEQNAVPGRIPESAAPHGIDRPVILYCQRLMKGLVLARHARDGINFKRLPLSKNVRAWQRAYNDYRKHRFGCCVHFSLPMDQEIIRQLPTDSKIRMLIMNAAVDNADSNRRGAFGDRPSFQHIHIRVRRDGDQAARGMDGLPGIVQAPLVAEIISAAILFYPPSPSASPAACPPHRGD